MHFLQAGVGIVVAGSYLAFVDTDGLHPEYWNKDCGKNYKFGDVHTIKAGTKGAQNTFLSCRKAHF